MKQLMVRRLVNVAVLLVFSLVALAIYSVYAVTLVDERFFTGWLLLGIVIVLTLLNARKKLPFLPIGSAATWLQFHVYTGLFAVVAFIIHVGMQLPHGSIDVSLSLLLFAVALSGVFGLVFARLLPVRLTSRPPAVLFERIPALRNQIAKEVEQLVLDSVVDEDSRIIPDLYAQQLAEFLSHPHGFAQHILGSGRPRRKLLAELEKVKRYANDSEKYLIGQIAVRVAEKDRLDYHYSLQWLLKGWLFVHIPLSYSLIIVALFHAWLAYLYSGSSM